MYKEKQYAAYLAEMRKWREQKDLQSQARKTCNRVKAEDHANMAAQFQYTANTIAKLCGLKFNQ